MVPALTLEPAATEQLGARKKSCRGLYGPGALGRLACMNRMTPPAAPAFEDLAGD
jgi:hypothetical protein